MNVCCAQVGASNELPESEELDALYDRFLLRRQVQQVSASGLTQLLAVVDAETETGTGTGGPPQPAADAMQNLSIPQDLFLTVR